MRSWVVRIIFLLLAIVLVTRLFEMQVLDERYAMLARGQSIIKTTVFPPRGAIIDRNGKPLVKNILSYDLMVTPANIKDIDTLTLCNIIGIDQEEFNKRIDKFVIQNTALRPSIMKPFLSDEENARLQENIYQFNGFEIQPRYSRGYSKPIAPHVLGYIHEVSKSMLESPRYKSYRSGDYVGISGLEAVYEEALRGQRGVKYIVRDVLNRPRSSYMNGAMDTPEVAGKDLELYLDMDLQELGEQLLQNKIGSAVAIDPKTGGILAMVSSPSFDPALLSGNDFSKNYIDLNKKFTRPLFNYAIQGQYPPGSTFKPIDAMVALETRVITPNFGIGCVGGYYGCGRMIGCTEHWAGHSGNLSDAIAYSCNAYFCDIFKKIVNSPQWKGGPHEGLEQWHDYMNRMGIGHPLGVDITGEYGGNIPDSNYYNTIHGPSWNGCTMVTNGIGQGEVLLTPLQMANATAIIANRGYYYTPHFVKSIGGNDKDSVLAKYHKKKQVIHLSTEYFDAIIDGMENTVRKGTARRAQIPGIAVCGKTGTSENYGIINGVRKKLDNHSAFIAFAPKENPKIVVAVFVQNGGYGSQWGAPIASLMIEKYLSGSIKRQALREQISNGSTIRSYFKVIDSIQREKDYQRYLLKTADVRIKDSIKRKRDTMLVQQILKDYYHIH